MIDVKRFFLLFCVILAVHSYITKTDSATAAIVDEGLDSVKRLAGDKVNIPQISDNSCLIDITEHMKSYFQWVLLHEQPHFVQFKIKQDTNKKFNSTKEVFEPFRWSWTFAESSELYPFLSWKLDYGILSFHLLDAKTTYIKDVRLNVSEDCSISYGTPETTYKIVEAMMPFVNISQNGYPVYPESYFCYYYKLQAPQDFSTLRYQASLYFLYPLSYIGFKCSVVYWEYSEKKFNVSNQTAASHLSGYHNWAEMSLFPYFVGLVLMMFFPIVLFRIAGWLSANEVITDGTNVHELLDVILENGENFDNNGDKNWLYADGNSPFGLSDLLSFHTCGLSERHPVLVSRLRRVLFVLAAPTPIYLQCAMYLQGMGVWKDDDKITIKDLVSAGAPMGFLSIFGKLDEGIKVFAPLLGGPVGVIAFYYILGILFIALPKSFKQVIEDGIPHIRIPYKSPLFYEFNKIIILSMVNILPHQLSSGYIKASTMLKCRLYCLFTKTFWKSVLDDQILRVAFLSRRKSSTYRYLLGCTFLPIYILLCFTEILLCVVYYGLPFCGFVVLIVKGATRSVNYLGQQCRFFRFRVIFVCVFCSFSLFAYIISLVFIKSFDFVVQVISYTFVSVIIYPSVSFGYLFFIIVLIYYFVKLVRDFGDNYTELLTTAVELSRFLQNDGNVVYINNGHLNISNVNAEDLTDIRINGKQLDVSTNILQTLKNSNCHLKVKMRNNVYGIPRHLFNELVKKHKPVHVQFLSLCLKASLVIAFVIIVFNVCGNYVSGPTSEISEVMHVVFIVAIGAVPKLVEIVVSHSNTAVAREIEERRIQCSIVEYWSNYEGH